MPRAVESTVKGPARRSGRLKCWDFFQLPLHDTGQLVQFILPLQVQPQMGPIAAELPELKRHAGGDRRLFPQDGVQGLTRHVENLSQLGQIPAEGGEDILAEDLSGVGGRADRGARRRMLRHLNHCSFALG